MSVFKKFFSKIFRRATSATNEVALDFQDEILKIAARKAVAEGWEKNDSVVEEKKQNVQKSENISVHCQQPSEKVAVNFQHPHVQKIFKEYNKHFFNSFHVSDKNYKIKFEKDNALVQVNDAQFEAELSKSDKLALAYEYVFIRLVQKDFKNFDCRLFLQAGDSVRRHRAYTASLAKKMALEVKRTRHKVTISSKSSYERSIIHATVAHIPGISSKSIGMSNQRRIVIYPANAHIADE